MHIIFYSLRTFSKVSHPQKLWKVSPFVDKSQNEDALWSLPPTVFDYSIYIFINSLFTQPHVVLNLQHMSFTLPRKCFEECSCCFCLYSESGWWPRARFSGNNVFCFSHKAIDWLQKTLRTLIVIYKSYLTTFVLLFPFWSLTVSGHHPLSL